MSKRYTQQDDETIVAYLDLVGSDLGPSDLGRTAKSVSGRAGFLRKSGAWAAIERKWQAQIDYQVAVDPVFARQVKEENVATKRLTSMHKYTDDFGNVVML